MNRVNEGLVITANETYQGVPINPNSCGIIVARNGIFRFAQAYLRSIPFFTVVATDGKPLKSRGSELQDIVPGFHLHLPRIPFELIEPVESFFRWVYDNRERGEAEVLLFYSLESEQWQVGVHNQVVSPASVEIDAMPAPKGYAIAGSIHSHSSFHAFHSGQDDHAELDSGAGVHLVIGHVNNPRHSYSASVVFGNTRYEVPISALVELREPVPFPKQWQDRVQVDQRRGAISTLFYPYKEED